MRWQVLAVFILLAGPVLAGCIEPDEPDDLSPAIKEGYGLVEIHVRSPIDLDKYPFIWSLQAVPRHVGFFPGDNETMMRLNSTGLLGVAKGWTQDWLRGNETGPYPPEAVQDWMQPRSIWYEGEVPAGNYSLIRVEFVELKAKHVNGREIYVRALGDRLSAGAPEDGFFTVREGKTNTFVLNAVIVPKGEYDFEIR
jgi:hypothetical protein